MRTILLRSPPPGFSDLPTALQGIAHVISHAIAYIVFLRKCPFSLDTEKTFF